jgi:type I restriction enzyme S subunit
MSELSYIDKLLDGVEVKRLTLGDIGEFIRGNGIQKKDLVEAGFPAVHYGQIFTKYGFSAVQSFTFISDELAKKSRIAQKNDLLIATTSENDEDVLKSIAWLGEKVAISGDMMLFRHTQNVKYLAYYFQTEDFQKQKIKFITGAKVRRVSRDSLTKMTISLPSLKVQTEIVRILDAFAELTAELTAELVARRQQYAYYREQLLTFEENEAEWKDLGEVGAIRMCKRVLKSQTSDRKDIPFYKIGTFGKEPNAYITRELFDEYKTKYSYPQIGEVLISASGTIGRTVIFDGRDAYFQDSNIVWIENNESKVLNKYLFYFYQVVNWNVAEGGTIKRLYNDNLRKIKIPIPPLAEQQRIVTILDKFDALTTSLTEGLPREIALRQQQYEYYRELLLSFPKAEVADHD